MSIETLLNLSFIIYIISGTIFSAFVAVLIDFVALDGECFEDSFIGLLYKKLKKED